MAALKERFTNRASLKAAVDRHMGEPSRVPIYLTNHRHGTLDTFSLIPPINIRRKATAPSKKLRRSRPKIPASPPAAPGSRQVARGWPRCLQSAPASAEAEAAEATSVRAYAPAPRSRRKPFREWLRPGCPKTKPAPMAGRPPGYARYREPQKPAASKLPSATKKACSRLASRERWKTDHAPTAAARSACRYSAPAESTAAASATRRTETKAIGDQGRNAVTRPRWGQR